MFRFFRRLRYIVRQGAMERELAAEMEFHRAMKQAELEEDGRPPSEALSAASRELGNVSLMRENARAVWIRPWLESVWQDALYAARNLGRQPGFTAAAVLTLALGIGLNTSLFAFFNAFALRPWPVKDPGRVVNIYEISPKRARPDGFPLALVRYMQEHSSSFSGLFAVRGAAVRLGDEASGSRSLCQIVSGNYYRVLGVEMELGRGFLPEEDRLEAPQAVAVLSYHTWRSRFGGDAAILGRTIRLDDVPFTVVGVSSADFTGVSPEPVDFTVPMSSLQLLRARDESTAQLFTNPEVCCSSLAGRLRPQATRQQARADLELLTARFRGQGKEGAGRILLTGTAFLSHPDLKREFQPIFVLLFVGVLLVLLLACANVGNLLLARAAARQREIAVRLSLGAGRARVVRQLLTEGMVMALGAAAVAVLLACWLPQFVFQAALGAPAPFPLTLDLNVLMFALLVSAAACVGFALAPALHGTRVSLALALKDQAALVRGRFSMRKLLLGTQVFVSVLLLVSAGLLIRSARQAGVRDPGFTYRDVSVASIELPVNAYDAARTRALIARLVDRLDTEARTSPFALTPTPPFGSAGTSTLFRFANEKGGNVQAAYFQEVTPSYFDVLRIPMVAGHSFQASDRNRRVILVNETMARRFWPEQNPVGQIILVPEPSTPSFSLRTVTMEEAARTLVFRDSYEIIGIVKDAYTASLDRIAPTFYQPVSGRLLPYALLRNGAGAAQRLQAAISDLDYRAKVQVSTLSGRLNNSLRPMRVGASIAFVMGVLALLVASIGTLGVAAYLVQQRWQEIGMRMVLGARPWQVIWLVLLGSSRSAIVGLGLGLAASAVASMLLKRHLFGVGHLDPLTYVAVAVLVAFATLAASFWPLRRATRIDPMRALRCE